MTHTLRISAGEQRSPFTCRGRRSLPACCSDTLAPLRGVLVRLAPRLAPRIGGAQRLRTAHRLRFRVYARHLRLQLDTGLAPRRGGGLGAASQSWRGWTPCLPSLGCLRAMLWAWLQRLLACSVRPRGRPSSLRSRAPALRAAAGRRAGARQPVLGRAYARLLRDARPAGWRRPDLLLAPSKRVPASTSSRGGGLRPPLRDRRPWGRLALGDGLSACRRIAGGSPPPSVGPLGRPRLRGPRPTDLRPGLAPLRGSHSARSQSVTSRRKRQ